MVANAGIAQVKALLDVTPDDLRKIFDVNVFGVVYCHPGRGREDDRPG